jgi:hypothetical protein
MSTAVARLLGLVEEAVDDGEGGGDGEPLNDDLAVPGDAERGGSNCSMNRPGSDGGSTLEWRI